MGGLFTEQELERLSAQVDEQLRTLGAAGTGLTSTVLRGIANPATLTEILPAEQDSDEGE